MGKMCRECNSDTCVDKFCDFHSTKDAKNKWFCAKCGCYIDYSSRLVMLGFI